MVEAIVFGVCALIVIFGAVGVVWSRSSVHSALSLVATLFGVAVLFISMNAQFLGVVQVIVYTGAIVVLILFVIMLLGVDTEESLEVEPLVGQRWMAYLVGALLIVGIGATFGVLQSELTITGQVSGTEAIVPGVVADDVAGVGEQTQDLPTAERQTIGENNIAQVGDQLFTNYVFAFQIAAVLLTIAVIGAVLMAKRPREVEPLPEIEDESFEDIDELSTSDDGGEAAR